MRNGRGRAVRVGAAALVVVAMLGWGAGTRGIAQTAKPEQPRVRIGMVRGENMLPLIVAGQRGLFKHQGLDVELVLFNSTVDVLTVLIAGQVDVGATGMSEVITGVAAGEDVRAFWTVTRAMPYEIWGRPDLADLKSAKGARFAVSKYGAASDFFTRYAVQKSGLDPYKDIQVLQVGDVAQRVAALRGKVVDATILTDSGTAAVAGAGFKRLSVLKDLIPSFPFIVLTTRLRTMNEKPNTIRSVIRAANEAIPIINSDDSVVEDLMKNQKFTREQGLSAIGKMRGSFPLDGRSDAEAVTAMLDFLRRSGEIKQDLKPAELWDMRFITELGRS